ncbi:LamB/YcsF family protein [Oceanobacillus jeddahense]|uniref:5-oxoprolinase subunit PxpA n=1 Tax=Oceanobacillus jeddahense TaxID=1462527 RepID=A0ABY5JW31_9BACI|nr:5-oxoprolinase subunit PxpA [Oceanobacillus jeddahense]UUI04536.1 5-oxoprolinase subunit PxpA [Oceanobacillus jeddahense]
MNYTIDINTDIGEGFGRYTVANDEKLLDIVSSVNVACGFHAGDPVIMNHTVKKAAQNEVAIGAHPGLADLIGFGRRKINVTMEEVTTNVLYQLGALNAFTNAHNTTLRHISPHGQLGHYCVQDQNFAKAFMEAVKQFDASIKIVALDGELAEEAKKQGYNVVKQIFSDRAYNNDGTLVERSREGSVITNFDEMVSRTIQMIKEKTVRTIDGKIIKMDGEILCIHSDTANSDILAEQLKDELVKNDITISPST